ncbi:MAG: cobalt-zinc-cadmium efflux system membrane fusion protein [Saprospiraceae bacterium]|jgi:cobalt-zinc-cadmium efflux system membrane fusion protein
MKYISKIFILTIFAAFASCKSEVDSHTGHDHGEGQHEPHEEEAEIPENEVHLSNTQVKTIGVELGGFTVRKMSDFITATGSLSVPPSSVSSVHVPEGGFIRNLKKYIVGSKIVKGAVIATLEHPSFIQKQQDFLELQSEMIYLNQEMQRQKTLSEANASALKNYQKIQSEYSVKQIQMKGTQQYLNYLGINTENLNSGNITKQVYLTSPSSGYVSAVNFHNGMFAQPEMELMQIVNDAHTHVELDIFEKDIYRVKIGQKMTFSVASNPSETYEGKVYLISPTFESDKKIVHIHGHIEGKKPSFIQGAFVNAQIWENEVTVPCLPEKAVVIADNVSYIFVQKQKAPSEIQYLRIPVQVKQKKDGWVSVNLMEQMPTNSTDKIVLNQAFYLIAEMNKGTTSHSHAH